MKCPVCGTENKSTNRACFKCAHLLNDSVVQPKGNVNSLWYNKSAETVKPKGPPPFWGDTQGKPTYEDKSEFIVLHDESSNDNAAQDLVDSGAPVPDNRTKLSRLAGRREVEVVVPARSKPREQTQRSTAVRIRWPRLIVSTLVILMLFVGVGYGVFQLYQLIAGTISDMTNAKGDTAYQDPEVEKVMIDGESWHRITFFGKDGDMVLVTDPKRQLPIQKGKAELLLNDQGYITDEAQDKVTVSLEAIIVSPDNTERKITINPYDIEVPLAPLKIITPKEQNSTTDQDNMTVKIKVLPGSTRVLIGNQNRTDYINNEGMVTASVNIEPSGINTILITVETPKHRKNIYELKVNRPIMDVPIELSETTTDGTYAQISGSTVAGATITTDADLSGNITVDGNGMFRFKAKLKRWGWNDISITATDSSGKASTMVHRVNRPAALASYTKKAWKMDYSYLSSSAENLIGTVYKLEGVVIKQIENEESQYYLFNVGAAGENKPLIVEYTKDKGLQADKYYSIFADVIGVMDGYPVLSARFVYDADYPAGYTSPPASGSTATTSPEPSASESPAE